MEIETDILKILKDNGWNSVDYELMRENYIRKIKTAYEKAGCMPDSFIVEQLSLFYNVKIKYAGIFGAKSVLQFRTDNIKYYKTKTLVQQAQKFGVDSVIYLGDIDPAYYCLWMDNDEGIWIDFENEVYFCGKGIFEGVKNILNSKIVSK